MSEKVTFGIRVKIHSFYIPEKSNPIQFLYFFSYQVQIFNESKEKIRLISRYWKIRDAYGRIEEVEGEGVVGKQPIIEPKTYFEYTSFCPLSTSFGVMQGYYWMERENSEKIQVEIPSFQLISPQIVN